MSTTPEEKRAQSSKNSFAQFLAKNHRVLWTLGIILVVVAITAAVFGSINTTKGKKAYEAIEAAELSFEAWNDAEDKTEARTTLDEELDKILNDFAGTFGAQRALFMKAKLYGSDESYLESADTYKEIAMQFPKSYLAPISLMQAGIEYERAGESTKAFEIYNRLSENYGKDSGLTPRALFAQGRLSEENPEEASIYYNKLVSDYAESQWADLAQSRLIALGATE